MNAHTSNPQQDYPRRQSCSRASAASLLSEIPDRRSALSEPGRNRISAAPHADDFVRAMRNMASSVTIVATGSAPERSGMTATAICSLTADPPQMLACLNAGSSTSAAILNNGRFSINLLGNQDSALAGHFAGRGGLMGEQRFEHGTWSVGEHDVPILQNAIVSVECRVQQSIAVETHLMIVGAVLGIRGTDSSEPLLYGNGRFGGWTPFHHDGAVVSDRRNGR